MWEPTVGFVIGAAMTAVFGYLLVQAVRSGSLWVRKPGGARAGWKLRYWRVTRHGNPVAYWTNVTLTAAFFLASLFLAAWALLAPETLP